MADNVSATLFSIVSALNLTVSAFQDAQSASEGDVKATSFDDARNSINSATAAAQLFEAELLKAKSVPPPEMPQWNSPQNIEIFQGGGTERYAQEINSVNDMLSRLAGFAQSVSEQTRNLKILPPNAQADIGGMSARLERLRSRIELVAQSRIDIIGADKANAEVEQLRGQLNLALQAQENLNSAIGDMDVSAANRAYSQLNSIVDSAERNLRDNVNEQTNFNNAVKAGSGEMDGLKSKILGAVSAYASMQGIRKILDLSDEMANTTARLNLMNDGLQTTEELQNKIFLSAQNSRASYSDAAQTVGRLGMLAGKAFASNDEAIAFAEQMNKSFAIGGASIQEQTSAMYQLTQAMAAGKLQGDEYRSVIENAPLLAQAIESLMRDAGVEGTMKDWAAAGLLTADVIKTALFSAADETNARFEQMPTTFGQIWNQIQNSALIAFQPILSRLNQIANSPQFQTFVQNAAAALSELGSIIIEIFGLLLSAGSFVAENWSLIAPIIGTVVTALGLYALGLGLVNGIELAGKAIKTAGILLEYAKAAATHTAVAATSAETAAQMGLNAALLACPVTWIILAIISIIGLVYIIIGAINNFAGTSISASGVIFGAFTWLGSVIANIFMALLDIIFGVINYLVNPFVEFTNFLANIFINPISSIIYLFQGMADNVLSILQSIASALDFVFGSHMADAVAGWRASLKGMADKAVAKYAPNENYTKAIDNLDLSVENTLGWKRLDNTDAYNAGYKAGENLENSLDFGNLSLPGYENSDSGNWDASDMARDVASINGNTKDLKDIREEDLKYFHDIAEREAINRFTTADINVNLGGVTNNLSEGMDFDATVRKLSDGVAESLETAAEGARQ
jgi:tape measure domain-containing protein